MTAFDLSRRAGSGPVLRAAGVGALALSTLAVAAQEASDPRRFVVTPSFSVSETLTDNYRGGTGTGQAESITAVTPGLRITSRAGRVQGAIDYSLSGVVHARDTSANEVRHRLAANVSAEAVQNHLFIDLRGSISRQPISALNFQAPDPDLGGSSYTDVRTFTASPVLRGTLGGVVDLQARLLASGTDSGSNDISDSATATASLRLASVATGARLGWSFDASRQIVDFDQGRRTEEDRVVGGLSIAPNPELRLRVRAGVENGDVASLTKERTNTWGAGLSWTPTDRTRIALDADKRSFGHSHALSFEHRMRRSVWRYSDRQDVSSGTDASGAAVPAYDLFYALFASQEPDPVRREQLVNAFLQRNNLTPDDLLNGGLLSSSSAVQRLQELSFAVEGPRTTYLISATATSNRQAFEIASAPADLVANDLKQRGLNFGVVHRLTPTATLNLRAATMRSSSVELDERSRLNTVSASWTDRLSRRASLSLGVRHSAYDSSVGEDYKENALLANFGLVF